MSIIRLVDLADHQPTLLLIIVSITKPVWVIYQRQAPYSSVGFPVIKIDFLSDLKPPSAAKLVRKDKRAFKPIN